MARKFLSYSTLCALWRLQKQFIPLLTCWQRPWHDDHVLGNLRKFVLTALSYSVKMSPCTKALWPTRDVGFGGASSDWVRKVPSSGLSAGRVEKWPAENPRIVSSPASVMMLKTDDFVAKFGDKIVNFRHHKTCTQNGLLRQWAHYIQQPRCHFLKPSLHQSEPPNPGLDVHGTSWIAPSTSFSLYKSSFVSTLQCHKNQGDTSGNRKYSGIFTVYKIYFIYKFYYIFSCSLG